MHKDVSRRGFEFWARVIGTAWAAALGLTAAGCNSLGGGGQNNTPMVSAVRHPTLEDFPVPNGFSLVDAHSQARAIGSMRMVQFEFSGSLSRALVARFYEDKLPLAGWTLKGTRFERGGEYVMRFESDKEECDLRIRPSNLKTLLNVDIGPLPHGSAERSARKP
jgi:hypothetical protein